MATINLLSDSTNQFRIQIEQRFLCPRCKTVKQQRHKRYKNDSYMEPPKASRDQISFLDDDMPDDMDGDDLNVTLDEELPDKHPTAILLSSSRPVAPLQSPAVVASTSSLNDNSAFSINMSPPSLFLQPECCVQEEVVEISYASRSDSDS